MDYKQPVFIYPWTASWAAAWILGKPEKHQDQIELYRRLMEAMSLEELKNEDGLIRPKFAIAWAMENNIPISSACAEWYAKVTKQKPKTGQPGPRDETLYRLIAAMARALEYTPGQGEKSGQNKLKMIRNHTALDSKTIRKHIEDALNKFPNDGE
jgi:hypothetical protein